MRNHLRRHAKLFRQLLIGASSMTSISCGDDQSPRLIDGAISVEARTTGDDFDANGYLVSINNSQGEEIGNLDRIFFTALEPGDYQVSLGGMTENCTVPPDDNPQTAIVVPGDTVDVIFDITCELAEPPDDGGGGNPI